MSMANYPHPPEFGPDIPGGDVQAALSEVDELRGGVYDTSSDLGRWTLAWGLIGVLVGLLLHGPVFFVAQLVLCGAAFVAWLLCGRRFRAGIPQSRGWAWTGLLLALLGLGLGFAGAIGHPLVSFGVTWRLT
jgi:hypothetical protein